LSKTVLAWRGLNVSNPQRIATNIDLGSLLRCSHLCGFKPSKDRYKRCVKMAEMNIVKSFKPSKDRYKRHSSRSGYRQNKSFKPSKDRYKHIRGQGNVVLSGVGFKPSKDRYKHYRGTEKWWRWKFQTLKGSLQTLFLRV